MSFASTVTRPLYRAIDAAPFVGKMQIQPAMHKAWGTAEPVARRAAQHKAIATIKSMRSCNLLIGVAAGFSMLQAHHGITGDIAMGIQALYSGAHIACAARQTELISRVRAVMKREAIDGPPKVAKDVGYVGPSAEERSLCGWLNLGGLLVYFGSLAMM